MAERDPAPRPDRDHLVERYRHLVRYVVDRLGVSVTGVFDHDDAMQAGMMGMVAAAGAYRPESGASFESYAILRIRGAILDAVRALDPVGRAGRDALRAISIATAELSTDLGGEPTDAQIALRMGLSPERLAAMRRAAAVTTVSLDAAPREADADPGQVAETLADPVAIDPLEQLTRREELGSLVSEVDRLSTRNRRVIALYYRDEMTFREIASVLGVSESRACQIHRSTLLGLRERLAHLRGAPRPVAPAG